MKKATCRKDDQQREIPFRGQGVWAQGELSRLQALREERDSCSSGAPSETGSSCIGIQHTDPERLSCYLVYSLSLPQSLVQGCSISRSSWGPVEVHRTDLSFVSQTTRVLQYHFIDSFVNAVLGGRRNTAAEQYIDRFS